MRQVLVAGLRGSLYGVEERHVDHPGGRDRGWPRRCRARLFVSTLASVDPDRRYRRRGLGCGSDVAAHVGHGTHERESNPPQKGRPLRGDKGVGPRAVPVLSVALPGGEVNAERTRKAELIAAGRRRCLAGRERPTYRTRLGAAPAMPLLPWRAETPFCSHLVDARFPVRLAASAQVHSDEELAKLRPCQAERSTACRQGLAWAMLHRPNRRRPLPPQTQGVRTHKTHRSQESCSYVAKITPTGSAMLDGRVSRRLD